MKKIMFVLAVVALATGCSSKKKADEAAAAPVMEQKATDAAATDAKADKKSKKAKGESTDAAATGDTAAAPEAFGAINGTEKSSFSCTKQKDSRKITIMNVTEGGCGVVYNKYGETKTVAMAKSASYCDSVAGKIKTNLEGSGYDCGGGSGTSTPAEEGTSSSD